MRAQWGAEHSGVSISGEWVFWHEYLAWSFERACCALSSHPARLHALLDLELYGDVLLCGQFWMINKMGQASAGCVWYVVLEAYHFMCRRTRGWLHAIDLGAHAIRGRVVDAQIPSRPIGVPFLHRGVTGDPHIHHRWCKAWSCLKLPLTERNRSRWRVVSEERSGREERRIMHLLLCIFGGGAIAGVHSECIASA
jgi:hypothetical protein